MSNKKNNNPLSTENVLRNVNSYIDMVSGKNLDELNKYYAGKWGEARTLHFGLHATANAVSAQSRDEKAHQVANALRKAVRTEERNNAAICADPAVLPALIAAREYLVELLD